MKKNIIVSVILISYNQERYIRDAIESVIMQKTNFKYELLLADDCSPDNTKDILLEYEKKYDFIKIVKREKNLGATKNILDAATKSVGKYITILEGDDYWTDKNKLQRQVDFLEKKLDFIAISHLQEGRNLNGEIMGYFPKCIQKDTTIDGVNHLIKKKLNFSSSASLYRNIYKDKKHKENISKLFELDKIIGDAQICIYLCSIGKVYVENKAMMVYRMRNDDGNTNFNSMHKVNEIEYRNMKIYIGLDNFFNHQYNFYNKYKNCYTIGVLFDIIKLNFKDIKKFNQLCPKPCRKKIMLLFPFSALSFVVKRIIKK